MKKEEILKVKFVVVLTDDKLAIKKGVLRAEIAQ